MKRFLLALTVAATAYGMPVAAQRATHIALGGGVAVPVGKFGNDYESGPQGLVSLITGSPDSPFGLRLDYSYNSFRGDLVGGTVRYAGTHINSLTANLVITGRAGAFKPYAVGGGGWYPYREAGETTRTNAFGLNGGLGLGFPIPYSQIGGFIEARYHAAYASNHLDRRFVPITLGVMF